MPFPAPQAPNGTVPFLPIYNGPEEDGLIGFLQEHDWAFRGVRHSARCCSAGLRRFRLQPTPSGPTAWA